MLYARERRYYVRGEAPHAVLRAESAEPLWGSDEWRGTARIRDQYGEDSYGLDIDYSVDCY